MGFCFQALEELGYPHIPHSSHLDALIAARCFNNSQRRVIGAYLTAAASEFSFNSPIPSSALEPRDRNPLTPPLYHISCVLYIPCLRRAFESSGVTTSSIVLCPTSFKSSFCFHFLSSAVSYHWALCRNTQLPCLSPWTAQHNPEKPNGKMISGVMAGSGSPKSPRQEKTQMYSMGTVRSFLSFIAFRCLASVFVVFCWRGGEVLSLARAKWDALYGWDLLLGGEEMRCRKSIELWGRYSYAALSSAGWRERGESWVPYS